MFKLVIEFLNKLFMYYIFIYSVIFFISTISSILEIYEDRRKKRYLNEISIKSSDNYIPVSVLVPAYNEEKTIVDCIESLSHLEYAKYEIIVIDDGSKDNTSQVIIDNFKLKKIVRPIRRVVKCKREIFIYEGYTSNNKKITLVKKENGGKADALNMGINISKYPLFVSLDADSILQKDSLKNIAKPFIEDDKTIAVGGNIKAANQVVLKNGEIVKIRNPKKLIVILQIIEYYRVFLTTRVWFNRFNGNLIISGAFGIFKKSSVINIGGYDTDTVGEDMDLVVKLHSFYRKNKLDYSIKYAYDAICWSQVPEKLRDFKNQRRRWNIGLMTSLINHRYILLNPKYGVVGVFSFLYFLIYELLSCVFDIVGLVIIVLAYFTGILSLDYLFTFFVMYISYSIILSVSAILLENYSFKHISSVWGIIKLVLFSIIESLGYRQFCTWCRLTGIIGYRKRKHQWGKISRVSQNRA